ncbi:butyrate kinase [Candidatus Magnetomorum sp. HK-1]|nr:butyrate kinase [Candidatus Magnetomorum sp. HK-1]
MKPVQTGTAKTKSAKTESVPTKNVPTKLFEILVINPGSTSTKIAIFQNENCIVQSTITLPSTFLEEFPKVIDQLEIREQATYDFLSANNYDLSQLDGVVGRGGLLKPMPGGTYKITSQMCKDLLHAKYGEHASNLGVLLADRISKKYHLPAFIVDPVSTDEFLPESKISGVPGIERKCRSHALSIKSVARSTAKKIKKDLSKTNFVIAHLGGGVSICALKQGKIIDSTDGMLGEGPFSLERAGTLASERVIEMCLDQKLAWDQMIQILTKESGFKGYLDETNLQTIYNMINNGDKKARKILSAFVMQVVKWIGAMTALLKGKVDSIIITGGLANSDTLIQEISLYIENFAPITVIPGELEMEALAAGAIRVLSGNESAKIY